MALVPWGSMKKSIMKALVVVTAASTLCPANASAATVIFNALDTTNAFNTVRSGNEGPLGVTTFTNATTISGFGVLNAMSTAGTQTFYIFNQDTGATLYQSVAKAFGGDGSTAISANTYKLTDSLLFTFLPGVRYAIGSTASVRTGYYVASGAATQNGITVAAGNSNVSNSRIIPSQACCSTGIQLFADAVTPAIPEPNTWALMMVGFAMVGGAARYRRRTTKIAYA